MRTSWCLSIGALLIATAACAPPVRVPAAPAPTRSAPLGSAPITVRVRVSENGAPVIRAVPLEDYVKASALSEFAPGAGDLATVERMLEVQSVVARTYALANLGRHAREGFDLCSTTHCQLYEPRRLQTSRWAAAAEHAMERTRGRVLWFDGSAAIAVFHADCGGHTSAATDVWGGTARPYLSAMDDDGPASSAHATWSFEATADEVRKALDADSRTDVGVRLDSIQVMDRDPAGRAMQVALNGATDRLVRGEDLRDVLARAFGARSIKSTWFDVRRSRARFVFEGRGFGHGVGLCQAGALARLKAGAKPDDVLAKYFPRTRILTLKTSSRTPRG